MYRGVVHKIFKMLRVSEAALGSLDFEKCKQKSCGLQGNLEVDGHQLGKCFVSTKNPHFQAQVEAWKKKHPREVLPTVLQCLVGVLGICRRGGSVLVAPRIPVLITLGSAPPPESEAEVLASNILFTAMRPCKINADGAQGCAAMRSTRSVR